MDSNPEEEPKQEKKGRRGGLGANLKSPLMKERRYFEKRGEKCRKGEIRIASSSLRQIVVKRGRVGNKNRNREAEKEG